MTQKSKEKPGKVIRVDTHTWKFLTQNRRPKEQISTLVRRLFGIPARKNEYEVKTFYILPESRIVCDSIEEARGEAILRAVRKGKKKPSEKPLEVRPVAG